MMKLVWDSALKMATDEFISLSKGPEVVAAYTSMEPGLAADHGIRVVRSGPAQKHQLARAHDLRYVEGVLACQVPNGFGNTRPDVLAQVLAANGVMIKAVQEALHEPEHVVCAPVSGFHHASYHESAGYCTFNGLLVAVACARVQYPVPNVLIIDGDAHYGDGTDDILLKTQMSGIVNLTHRTGGPNSLNKNIWEQTIRGLLTNRHWDLVLYQAGADCHMDDPYGSGYLSAADWDHRDELVFNTCRRLEIPLVFNFAGGYNGDATIALHRRTLNCARALYRSAGLEKQSQA